MGRKQSKKTSKYLKKKAAGKIKKGKPYQGKTEKDWVPLPVTKKKEETLKIYTKKRGTTKALFSTSTSLDVDLYLAQGFFEPREKEDIKPKIVDLERNLKTKEETSEKPKSSNQDGQSFSLIFKDETESINHNFTMESFTKLKEEVEQKNHQSVISLLLAFDYAVSLIDSDKKTQKSKIPTELLTEIFFYSVSNFAQIFGNLLNYSPLTDQSKPKLKKFHPATLVKWEKKHVHLYARFFLNSLLKALEMLNNELQIVFIVERLKNELMPYLSAFPKLAKAYLLLLLKFLCHDSTKVRLISFGTILKMALELPYPFVETCLQGIYLASVSQCKNFLSSNVEKISFLRKCVVELFGLDFICSTNWASIFINLLGLRLKASQNKRVTLCDWQFIQAIETWVHVLSAYPQQEHLQNTIYPLVSLILSGIDEVHTRKQCYPLVFHLIRLLNRLSFTNGVFIQCQSYLLQIIQELNYKAPDFTPESNPEINLDSVLKVSKLSSKTWNYQKACFDRSVNLLIDSMSIHSYHISFPELFVPLSIFLQRLIKDFVAYSDSPNYEYLKHTLSELFQMFSKNAEFIKTKRADISFNSHELFKVDRFLLQEQHNETPFTSLMKHRSTYRNILSSEPLLTYALVENKTNGTTSKKRKLDETKTNGTEKKRRIHVQSDNTKVKKK
eukprot:TRINITY_DN6076_c0_g1_i1.p1 TRINITY_DN6076_c0_g1~~TRINITY_DN6076_c0_g1_i1.p1  ORF type:complete len:719 (+),score=141.06 TRINITY_DN6076_c0_g1_i1:146-2158(+)